MSAPEASQRHDVTTPVKDYGLNSFQAMLLAIPYIGPTLERLIFGVGAEHRWQRLEATLQEVGESLRELGRPSQIEAEEFARLLEQVTGPIARATAPSKRERFRDILINAATTPPGDPRWEEASLAADLVTEIEAPGLDLLAKIWHMNQSSEEVAVAFTDPPRIYRSREEALQPQLGLTLGYAAPVIEEWMRRLGEMRLVHWVEPIHIREGNRHIETIRAAAEVRLNPLGEMLVRWSLADSPTISGPSAPHSTPTG